MTDDRSVDATYESEGQRDYTNGIDLIERIRQAKREKQVHHR